MHSNQERKLSVIVVSFNTSKLTKECLASILEHGGVEKQDLEVIVVDNASTDDSVAAVEALAKQYSGITLIKNSENVGFAKANNQGIKKANGEIILLLNSDTVVQKDALAALVEAHKNLMQRDEQWLLASSLQNADGSYQPQGGTEVSLLAVAAQWWLLDDIPFVGSILPTMQNRRPPEQKTGVIQMGWVGGTTLSFPKKLVDEIGLLDESIFMYAEDVEYCLRAKKANKHCGIVTQSIVTHYGSASSTNERALLGEVGGLLKLWPKYFGTTATEALRLIISLGAMLRIALFGVLGRGAQARSYAKILKLVWV